MNNKTKLILLRHGETNINVEGRLDGQYDSHLTPDGVAQAEKVAAFLQKINIDVMYTSKLQRSINTGGFIAEYHKGLKIFNDQRLNEIDCGIVTTHKKSDFLNEYPDIKLAIDKNEDYQFPEGESIEMVEKRCMPYINEILQINKGKTIFISGHKTLNATIIGYFLRIPYGLRYNIEQDNCCLNQLSFVKENISLDFVNFNVSR